MTGALDGRLHQPAQLRRRVHLGGRDHAREGALDGAQPDRRRAPRGARPGGAHRRARRRDEVRPRRARDDRPRAGARRARHGRGARRGARWTSTARPASGWWSRRRHEPARDRNAAPARERGGRGGVPRRRDGGRRGARRGGGARRRRAAGLRARRRRVRARGAPERRGARGQRERRRRGGGRSRGGARPPRGTMPIRGTDTITVPGAVAAWEAVGRLGARLPWAERLDGRGGVRPRRRARLPRPRAGGRGRGAADPGRSTALQEVLGDGTLRQPALADTLEALRDGGADALYRGEVGARLVAGLRALGSPLAQADLAAHATEVTAPLHTRFAGRDVLTAPPNSQGYVLLELLRPLEEVGGVPDPAGPRARGARGALPPRGRGARPHARRPARAPGGRRHRRDRRARRRGPRGIADPEPLLGVRRRRARAGDRDPLPQPRRGVLARRGCAERARAAAPGRRTR